MTPCATTATTERSGQVEQQDDEGGRRRRGAFIVFEGLDRAGKSTQVERLCERLTRRGHRVKQIRFPDRTSPIGLVINSYLTQKDVQLSDEAIHLLFSANRWEKAQEIEEELKRGTTVVCDRYSFSGIAFSVIKGLSWEWCESPDRGLPSPDLTLFLSLSSETARRRAGFGGERYETQEIQDEVRRVFELIGRRLSSSSSSSSSLEERGTLWREVSAEGTIDQVEENVWEQVDDVLNGKESDRLERGIGKLWV